eukprot:4549056-Prymnesium_polylepis.1
MSMCVRMWPAARLFCAGRHVARVAQALEAGLPLVRFEREGREQPAILGKEDALSLIHISEPTRRS